MKNPIGAAALAVVLLSLLAYARSLTLPLIEDDYPNIRQAQTYGPLSGLPALVRERVFTLRATSYWVMFGLWQAFGVTGLPYHLASLALHIANALLVYGIARAWPPVRAGALWAAAFFAVQEGHQEAVMWFSAINELLMFFFGCGALLCWLLAMERQRARALYAASVLLFGFALISKESALFLLPLFFLTVKPGEWRRAAVWLLPHLALAALAAFSILSLRNSSFRFLDGSFSLAAPFWITWPRSFFRLLWVWGLLAGAVIGLRRASLAPLAWIGIALVPYSFLTYSTQIPSRQTYLASAGLAFLVGLAVARLPRRVTVAAFAAVLAVNVGYLWTRKHKQFVERAEPTEQLIRLAKTTNGPIWVKCFPRPWPIAQEAVRLAAGRPPSALIWSEADAAERKPAAVFCVK